MLHIMIVLGGGMDLMLCFSWCRIVRQVQIYLGDAVYVRCSDTLRCYLKTGQNLCSAELDCLRRIVQLSSEQGLV
jgi:hypothetical protein